MWEWLQQRSRGKLQEGRANRCCAVCKVISFARHPQWGAHTCFLERLLALRRCLGCCWSKDKKAVGITPRGKIITPEAKSITGTAVSVGSS